MGHILQLTALAMMATAGPAGAAESVPATIHVTGTGEAKTMPGLATVAFSVRGEGRGSDDAIRAMTARQQAVARDIAGVQARTDMTTGALSVDEVRGPKCRHGDDDFDDARLSTGDCAIIGYVATLSARVRVTPVAAAGTVLGVISRAGGSDPSLHGFEVQDQAAARKMAVAAAMQDAQAQAAVIAEAAGVTLGRIASVQNGSTKGFDEEIVVTGTRTGEPLRRAPVRIDLNPEPVTTVARLAVVFEIAR